VQRKKKQLPSKRWAVQDEMNILKSTIEKEARILLTYENNTLFFYRPL